MDNNENEVLTNEPAQSEVPEQAEQTVEPSSMHDALFPESEPIEPPESVEQKPSRKQTPPRIRKSKSRKSRKSQRTTLRRLKA